MTKPALISVKASLTKMTPLLATSCGASAVTPLSAETVRDWAVGEECPLFSSSRSVGWGLGGTHQSQPHPQSCQQHLETVPAYEWQQDSQHFAIWIA